MFVVDRIELARASKLLNELNRPHPGYYVSLQSQYACKVSP